MYAPNQFDVSAFAHAFTDMTNHSSIFKTHEMRHMTNDTASPAPQPALVTVRSSLDKSIMDTMRQMSMKSTVYKLHEQRHGFVVNTQLRSKPEISDSCKSASTSPTLSQLATQSTIFKRHEQRHRLVAM